MRFFFLSVFLILEINKDPYRPILAHDSQLSTALRSQFLEDIGEILRDLFKSEQHGLVLAGIHHFDQFRNALQNLSRVIMIQPKSYV